MTDKLIVYPERHPRIVVQIPEKGCEITRVGEMVFKRWLPLNSPWPESTRMLTQWMRVPKSIRHGIVTNQYKDFMERLDRRQTMMDNCDVEALRDGAL